LRFTSKVASLEGNSRDCEETVKRQTDKF